MRRRALDLKNDPGPPPTGVELVRAATREYARAKRSRDSAIAQAKANGKTSLRELAEAADLSVSRIKQIAVGAGTGDASLPAVPEMDLSVDRAIEHADGDDHDRVFALRTVHPWFEQWPSEREFLRSDPRRLEGNRSDLAFELYDLDPTARWTLVYAHSTREVYAFGDKKAESSAEDDAESTDPTTGSSAGPCVVIGHAYSYDILDVGVGYAVHNVLRRPGGLAWVYGRLRLLNRLLATTARGMTGFTADPTVVWQYLDTLAPSEKEP